MPGIPGAAVGGLPPGGPLQTALVITLVVVAALVLATVLALVLGRRAARRARLRRAYGPEYDRTVAATGGRRAAERDLTERAELRRELDVRPLDPASRQRYQLAWAQ